MACRRGFAHFSDSSGRYLGPALRVEGVAALLLAESIAEQYQHSQPSLVPHEACSGSSRCTYPSKVVRQRLWFTYSHIVETSYATYEIK
jgi:hypothetical protein